MYDSAPEVWLLPREAPRQQPLQDNSQSSSPHSKSDRAKRPCALFKISNEQTYVPVVASHYKTRQTYITLLFVQLIAQRKKNLRLRGHVSQTGPFGYYVLQDDYSGWVFFKVFHYDYFEVNNPHSHLKSDNYLQYDRLLMGAVCVSNTILW